MAHSARSRRGAANSALIVIGILILVALVGVIVALVVLLNRQGERESAPVEEAPQRSVLITEENIEEVIEEMAEEPAAPAPASYDVSMTMDWTFPDGASPSPDAYVANVESNTTDVYFDLMRRDSGEVIYSSPVLPVGSELRNFALDKPLGAGTYSCVIEYHLVDESQNTLGTVNMGLTITVQN